MFGVLFTLPDASTTLASVGAYSSPVFSDLFPILELIVGIGLAIAIVIWIAEAVMSRGKH